jgi:hypothetical protein
MKREVYLLPTKNEYVEIPAYTLVTAWGAVDFVSVKKSDCPIQRETPQIRGYQQKTSTCVPYYWEDTARCTHYSGYGKPYGGGCTVIKCCCKSQ